MNQSSPFCRGFSIEHFLLQNNVEIRLGVIGTEIWVEKKMQVLLGNNNNNNNNSNKSTNDKNDEGGLWEE